MPEIMPAFEVTYIDIAKPNKQKRLKRIFRVRNLQQARHDWVVWSLGEKIRTGIQYKSLSFDEVLAEPSAVSLAQLSTRFVKAA